MTYGLLNSYALDLASVVLRLALAAILIYHGWPKLKRENIKNFTQWLLAMGFPLPAVWAIIVSLLEPFGGILLILGFATRLFAILFVIEFFVITFVVKSGKTWKDNREFDFIIMTSSLALAFLGGGLYSFDMKFFEPVHWINTWFAPLKGLNF